MNCDSLQIYRGFDIGTAKTPLPARGNIPHHLFDVLRAGDGYSAGEYAQAARAVIKEIAGRQALPVVVGGTGFYLRALLEGLPALPERDTDLRARLMRRQTAGPGSLHRILRRFDPAAAGRIHVQDVQKTLRALEICLLTRTRLPEKTTASRLEGFSFVKIGLAPERVALAKRLEQRTRKMFENGLIEEVRAMLAGGATGDEKPFESLGYKQTLRLVRGQSTRAEAVESTIVETRQYAKRQLTWFRRDAEIRWLHGFGDDEIAMAEAAALVRASLRYST